MCFSVPGMPMLYHFEAFSWWWLGWLGKMLYHLGIFLPWCQQSPSIPLDFCWHQLHFLPIWCSIKNFGFAFTVSIIFILGCFDTALWSSAPLTVAILSIFPCFDTALPARTKQTPICCLPARGGADVQVDKGSILGWAGKREEALVWACYEKYPGGTKSP